MNSFRRRLMSMIISQDAPNYVMDGLVFWLDGINKGQNQNAWTDIINGIIFQADGATPVNYGWETGQNKKLINSDSLSFPVDSCTIEVAITRAGPMVGGQIDVVSTLSNNNITLSFDGDRVYLGHVIEASVSCYVPSSSADGVYCISGKKGTVVVNCQSYYGTERPAVGSANYNSIGSRGNGLYYLTGTIHAVRIYNRLLSESEMQQNQRVDNRRFRLGLSL